MQFAEEALTGDVAGIHGFWHENIFEAVYCTNLLMRSCDSGNYLCEMCDNIERNKKAGIYDGAYRVVELAKKQS